MLEEDPEGHGQECDRKRGKKTEQGYEWCSRPEQGVCVGCEGAMMARGEM